MPNITDNQIRGIALKKAYEKRREGFFQWQNEDFKELDPSIEFDLQDLLRACDQLSQHGLIEFKALRSRNEYIGGALRITALGTDVIEGNRPAPISVTYDQSHHVNVTASSNVQIGNSNTQNLSINIESLMRAIDASHGSNEEKDQARNLLRRFLEHPLVAALVSGISSNIKL